MNTKSLMFSILLLIIPVQLSAQATINNKILFDQGAIDLATANSYTYKYYPDNAAVGVNLPTVCTGTSSPFTCSAAFPAFTPGSHTLTITASNIAGESPKSSVLSFTFVIIPSIPTNVRIQ